MKFYRKLPLHLFTWMFVISLGGSSCIERFEPTGESTSNVLVVEGHISDLAEPQTIRLSRTRPLNDTKNIPETGAAVEVSDSRGVRYAFLETAPGQYQSDPAVFAGQLGEKYVLHIRTAGGTTYKSSQVTLKKTPPIDDVYFEEVTRLNDAGETVWGISILLDAHDPENATSFYRWDWVENFEIKMPRPSKFVFQVDKDTVGGGYPVPRLQSVEFCYNADTSTNIMIESAKSKSQSKISRYELNFVSTNGFELQSFYGIIVRQYALDEGGYNYWSELKKTSEALGTLFDPQPYELRGNIYNETDPAEPVFGYFDASTIAVNSLVLIRDQLINSVFPYEICFGEIDSVQYDRVPEYLSMGYLIDTLGTFGMNFLYMAPARCSDCRLYGSLERPKFRPE